MKQIISFTIVVISFLLHFCIVSAEEAFARSSSLKQICTTVGNQQRIDYVNEDGEITYAIDKHYATLISEKYLDGVLESYYNTKGIIEEQPAGFYHVYTEYDQLGRAWKITYLGKDKKPIVTKIGYAIVERIFDTNGNVGEERYFDENGEPKNTSAYAYGVKNIYDKQGRKIITKYIGKDGKPAITATGYAIIHRMYYDEGKYKNQVKTEFYYDSDNNPIMLRHGEYGIYKEYDTYGRVSLITYLDSEGNPITTKEGYTTKKRTYYDDDSIEKEMYYDENGKNMSLSENQYGIWYKSGKLVYIDQYGQELFNIKRLLYNNEYIVIVFVLFTVCISIVSGRRINTVFFFIYIVIIIYMTLLFRNKTIDITNKGFFSLITNISLSRDSILELLNNVLLFVPFGTVLFCLYPDKKILWIPAFISIIIEIIQCVYKLGLCELSDIICNSMGSIIGFYTGCMIKNKKYKRKHRSICNS